MPKTSDFPGIHFTQIGEVGHRVLLIMGYGMAGDMWQPQIEGLRDTCRLIHFDHRGIGKSDAMTKTLSMRDMAEDAARVIDAAGWHDRVHVVGISMGGMVAQELALTQPHRLASLSLIATHAGGPISWLPTPKGATRFLWTQVGSNEKRRTNLTRLLYPDAFIQQCEANDLRMRMGNHVSNRPPALTMRKQFAAILRHDTRSRLPGLNVPTLIVKPEQDILIPPRNSNALHQYIPNTTLVSLADAGHGVTYQCAEQINTSLFRHFEQA